MDFEVAWHINFGAIKKFETAYVVRKHEEKASMNSNIIINKNVIIAVGVAVLLIIGGIIAYFVLRDRSIDKGDVSLPTPETEVSLNGIDVGITLSELQEKLGQPNSHENMGDYEIYSYDNLKVEVRDNKVYALMTDFPGVKTVAGVQVGSSFDDLVSRHGSDFNKRFDKLMIYEYSKPALNDQTGILIFSVDGSQDRVMNIVARLKDGSVGGPEAEQAKLALHRFLNAIARGESEIRKAYKNMLTGYYQASVNEEVFVKMNEQFSSLDFNENLEIISAKPNSVILKFNAGSRIRQEPSGTLYTPWTGEVEMVNEAGHWKINSVKAERGPSTLEKDERDP